MIEVTALTKYYAIGKETVKAVDKVDITVEKADFIAIVGHSGSGKTTLLSLMGGLTKPDSGSVRIDDVDLWSLSDNELSEFRNRRINFIYQFSSLIPTLDVMENVLLPTAFSKPRQDRTDYARELLRMVGLEEKIRAYPSQLSGGQQRRVAIARAFINNPGVLLADEPTGDLDEETEEEIMALFMRMNKDNGVTFVLVTHSSDIAARCKKLYRMKNGVLSS